MNQDNRNQNSNNNAEQCDCPICTGKSNPSDVKFKNMNPFDQCIVVLVFPTLLMLQLFKSVSLLCMYAASTIFRWSMQLNFKIILLSLFLWAGIVLNGLNILNALYNFIFLN